MSRVELLFSMYTFSMVDILFARRFSICSLKRVGKFCIFAIRLKERSINSRFVSSSIF